MLVASLRLASPPLRASFALQLTIPGACTPLPQQVSFFLRGPPVQLPLLRYAIVLVSIGALDAVSRGFLAQSGLALLRQVSRLKLILSASVLLPLAAV